LLVVVTLKNVIAITIECCLIFCVLPCAIGGFGGTPPRGFFREDTHGVDGKCSHFLHILIFNLPLLCACVCNIGDFAPLPAYHHQSTAHTPQYDQNGHFLGRTPQTVGGFSVEFARHAPTAAEEAHFAAHNRTYPPVSSRLVVMIGFFLFCDWLALAIIMELVEQF